MSNIQKQHKISPAIAWLTIQKFIIFYCPLDGEHTNFMLEQPWLSLFFYPYKRDCSADYVEQTEYDSDSENIRESGGCRAFY